MASLLPAAVEISAGPRDSAGNTVVDEEEDGEGEAANEDAARFCTSTANFFMRAYPAEKPGTVAM